MAFWRAGCRPAADGHGKQHPSERAGVAAIQHAMTTYLEAKLDLGFVREWARGLYTDGGCPSLDPVVCFKLRLVVFFEGIRSERQLILSPSGSGM